jgi:hypothetical protein
MTDYDFDALRSQLDDLEGPSMRDLAEDAWRDREAQCRRALLVAAQDTLHRILGETNGTDVEVELYQDPTQGTVQLTIDNIRFRVSVDDEKTLLSVRTSQTSWAYITDLGDLGRVLAKHPCYVVPPDGAVQPVKVQNAGLKGGSL